MRSSYKDVFDQDFEDAARPSSPSGSSFRVRDLVPATCLLAVGLIALLLASIQGDAAAGKFVVVAPPGWSLGRTVALVRAGDGRLLGTGNFANVVFAASSDSSFAARLRAAGAWLVEPAPLAPGCATPERTAP